MDEEQFKKLNDALDTMSSLMLGYKAKLMAGDMSEETSEVLVCQFHEVMCTRLIEIE